jgi:hypothetical protein
VQPHGPEFGRSLFSGVTAIEDDRSFGREPKVERGGSRFSIEEYDERVAGSRDELVAAVARRGVRDPDQGTTPGLSWVDHVEDGHPGVRAFAFAQLY